MGELKDKEISEFLAVGRSQQRAISIGLIREQYDRQKEFYEDMRKDGGYHRTDMATHLNILHTWEAALGILEEDHERALNPEKDNNDYNM